jgi:hypothetical protein
MTHDDHHTGNSQRHHGNDVPILGTWLDGWMDGWVILWGFVTVCAGFIPKAPRACAGIIVLPPPAGSRFRSPQDLLPRSCTHSLEQTQAGCTGGN